MSKSEDVDEGKEIEYKNIIIRGSVIVYIMSYNNYLY